MMQPNGERQQDRDIAALIESNKAMQRSLDHMREDFRDWLKSIEDTINERSQAAQTERVEIRERLATLEAAQHVPADEFGEVKATTIRLEKLAWTFGSALVGALIMAGVSTWLAIGS